MKLLFLTFLVDDMNHKVETMEASLNLLIEKSGVDMGEFAGQVKQEMDQLKLELRKANEEVEENIKDVPK